MHELYTDHHHHPTTTMLPKVEEIILMKRTNNNIYHHLTSNLLDRPGRELTKAILRKDLPINHPLAHLMLHQQLSHTILNVVVEFCADA